MYRRKSTKEGSLFGGGLSQYESVGLSSKGVFENFGKTSSTSEVWILSSTVLPQPMSKRGVWDDTANWSDTNVYYT